MAISNQERINKGLGALQNGLKPFLERELKAQLGENWVAQAREAASEGVSGGLGDPLQDVANQLKVMSRLWREVFGVVLGRSDRTLVFELIDVRNKWAHQEPFSSDDAIRALDTMERLLNAVSAAAEAGQLNEMKLDLQRLVYSEQVRGEKRKAGGSLIEAAATGALKPWREVVTPHDDVSGGKYQQAEFAADLWQVHVGEGTDEYRNPKEFFHRTFITASLKRLLVGAVRRLAGEGGDPVIQLQTNFGGGKTHSMLALYHLFSGVAPSDLPGVDSIMAEAGVAKLPKTKRVVLVGNKISPGNPSKKKDGTVVRTLWGELAWQLGGKDAYALVANDDKKATNPGDTLRELFNEYGPCLILIDEWVAYARQLHDQSDLPGGDFETHFSFAQALTESAKAAKNCLLVISLPASDTGGSPHAMADDAEVGGIRGREALDRLRHVIGRLESPFRPASAEEGFEIVRRRLFEPLAGNLYKQRDLTARAFSELYRSQKAEFPNECRDADYEKRIQDAYPIHPEVFDRLYSDWSTLVRFQRTRGVLRLMAAVIHTLWEKGDKNPLILPSTLPIDDPRVQFELTRYLSDNWAPIMEKDIAGPGSLPRKIDGEVPNLGKYNATERVARTIYLGSAPTTDTAHRGLEDRRITLGCVMPGEPPAIFGDALRRLASQATYLYQDGPRAWYSTQPTVTKLAEDRADQLRRDPDQVVEELEQRVRADLRSTGDFVRVHPFPKSGADVPDDHDARLVVLPAEHPYSKEQGNAAQVAAQAILDSRGNSPRHYRNTLVFLAADKARLQDLDEALRRYLAWKSILSEKNELDLTPHQVRQGETQLRSAEGAVLARLPETFQWLLVPTQKDAKGTMIWEVTKVGGSEPLAARASRKLKSEELLVKNLGSTILRRKLDEIPLWRGDQVSVRQLVEDYAQYLYLQKLMSSEVLMQSIADGVALLTWQKDTFAYAESYDEDAGRYRGIRAGKAISIDPDDPGLLVKPEIAAKQIRTEQEEASAATGAAIDPTKSGQVHDGTAPTSGEPSTPSAPPAPILRRFHGTVELDPTRVGRDASRIAEEVISHLAGQVGAAVTVTLEIEATLPEGASDQIVRTVSENSRTLKFRNHGFEEE